MQQNSAWNVKSEFSLPSNGSNDSSYENSNNQEYHNYESPTDFVEPQPKRRAVIYLDSALSPNQPASPWQPTNSFAGTSGEGDDQRFTAKRKQEIQNLIDHGQVIFDSSNEKGFHKVIHNNVPLGLQCATCFALFSTRTRTYLKSHVEKCIANTKNQAPYPLTVHEKRMITFYLAELMAMDSRFSLLAETEAFQGFISYIKNMGFNIGRKFANFTVPHDILPPPLIVKNSLESEVYQLVQGFKDFLCRQTKFEFVVALDQESLISNYMGISIQFLHNWQLKNFILNVEDVEKIGSNKLTHVIKILEQFNLHFDKKFIISDNDIHHFDNDETFLFCLSQTLKIIIMRSTWPNKDIRNEETCISFDKETLQILSEFQLVLDKLENVVEAICNKLNLSELENVAIFFERQNKWSSKIEMVESWLKITEADIGHLLINFGYDKRIFDLINDLTRSHDHLNAYIIVLKAFEDKLRFLQSDQYPTINHVLIAFYELENYLDHLKGSENILIKALWTSVSFILKNMKIHFTKPLHYAACTMDIFQRAKIRQLRETSEVKKAKEETEKLFLEYVKQITPTIDRTNEVHPDIDDFAMCADDELESNQNSAIISAKNELAQYYRYIPSAESIAQKDVLLFWKSVESQFPQLSKFVSSLFQIPASSNCIDKFCPISTKKAAKEKSMDSSMVSNLMLFKSLQNLNL